MGADRMASLNATIAMQKMCQRCLRPVVPGIRARTSDGDYRNVFRVGRMAADWVGDMIGFRRRDSRCRSRGGDEASVERVHFIEIPRFQSGELAPRTREYSPPRSEQERVSGRLTSSASLPGAVLFSDSFWLARTVRGAGPVISTAGD